MSEKQTEKKTSCQGKIGEKQFFEKKYQQKPIKKNRARNIFQKKKSAGGLTLKTVIIRVKAAIIGHSGLWGNT